MFVSERSFGRSDSKAALLRSWEARLEEAENGRPFAFRPMHRRSQQPQREGAKRTDEQAARQGNPGRGQVPQRASKGSRRS
jgi:hypothetical protein